MLVGVGIGAIVGFLARTAIRRGWASTHGIRPGVVLIPLITDSLATVLHSHGFVAAFLAVIIYKLVRLRGQTRRDDILRDEVSVLESVGDLSALVMWFVFGTVSALILLSPPERGWILNSLLALTIFRIIPMLLSFLGSRESCRERQALGVMGPRGTSGIVFGLLAFNAIDDADAGTVLHVMVVTVLGSVIFHGFFGMPLVGRLLWGRHGKVATVQG